MGGLSMVPGTMIPQPQQPQQQQGMTAEQLLAHLRTDSNPCISRPIARMGATTNRGTEKQINEVCVYDNETVH